MAERLGTSPPPMCTCGHDPDEHRAAHERPFWDWSRGQCLADNCLCPLLELDADR